jgi:UDP-N-acetyl-2-amino-2-deoxyglucuronate dehydrogenase
MDIRIGIVGSGFMGLTYCEALSKYVRGGRLAGIAGGSRAAALAGDYRVPHSESLEALLARGDVDAVVLATPDTVHCEQTLAAAAAGKHVLVEKPMAPNVAQCDRMIVACREAGVNLAVVKTERYRQLTRRAKALIAEGTIGEVRMLRTVSFFPLTVAKEIIESRPWYADPSGGGLFMGIATHNTDFLAWLAEAPVTQVFAQVATFDAESAAKGLTAQSVMAQMVFANGVMGHMWISAELPSPSLPASEVRFMVVGSEGMLDFENFEFLDLGKGETWERVFIPQRFDYFKEPKHPSRMEPHAGVLQEFVDSIRERRAPRQGGPEGRHAVEVCEACLTSARESRAVNLPLAA